MKYQKENKAYKAKLNKVYGEESIIAVERYINSKAVILHSCKICGDFYARPYHLISVSSQKHICFTNLGDRLNIRLDYSKAIKTNNRKVTDLMIQKMIAYRQQGMTMLAIAKKFNITRGTVSYYIKKQGLGD